ncbi:unnamed protein product [Prorocentrum cordatum]|uniref:Uncharacterized protein n=1 Tax=Prorocentrum cordatum TaxID=2364126 RepID=A0ABN9UEP3_9DINO|nr:unnamed protein product [Polarella glacialis]
MSAMLRELADAPHLSMRLRRAPHETAGSSFHASSPSSAEGAHAAASAHDSGTEGDESPRSLPQLQPLLSGDLELSESEVASSALLTARTLLTSRAGSKEHAKLMQTPEVTDRAAARQMTPDSPRSPASRPADSPSGSAGVARCAPELLDLDAGSAWSSPASGLGAGPWRSGPLAGPVVAAAPRAERVPPLPLGRRGAAAERPPLPQLPLPLEEAAARAGYAWEPETDEEYQETSPKLVGPTAVPWQAAARPSRACAWLGATPQVPRQGGGAGRRSACVSSHPVLLGLAAKLTCSDTRADKVRGGGLFL